MTSLCKTKNHFSYINVIITQNHFYQPQILLSYQNLNLPPARCSPKGKAWATRDLSQFKGFRLTLPLIYK
jgi:hypothetical protein